MLATVPRARAAARRLTTATAVRSPLAPPYAHTLGARPALAPPYTHPLAHVPEDQRLKAPYAFSLLREHVQVVPQTREQFVAEIIDTEAGREWATAEWTKALSDLAEQVSRLERTKGGRSRSMTITEVDDRASRTDRSDRRHPSLGRLFRMRSYPELNFLLTTSPLPLPRYHSRLSPLFWPTPMSATPSSVQAA